MSSGKIKHIEKVRINTDVLFVIMLILSVTMIYLFYRAWNDPKPSVPDESGSALQFFHIDSCTFGEKSIVVVGWAFLPGNWKILNRVYAERKNGELIELMSSTQPRRDVGESFKVGGMYDKSGFIATRRDNSAKNYFTQDILIVSVDENGVGHAAKYHCK